MSQAYLVPRAVQGDGPERLVAWRTAREMSQADLASALGCSQATISLVENGERYPPAAMVRAAMAQCRIPQKAWGPRPVRKHTSKLTPRKPSRKGARPVSAGVQSGAR